MTCALPKASSIPMRSFVCGYYERRPGSVWARGGFSWPLARIQIESNRLVMRPRGPLGRIVRTTLALEDVERIEVKHIWRFGGFRFVPRSTKRGILVVALGQRDSELVKDLLRQSGLGAKFPKP